MYYIGYIVLIMLRDTKSVDIEQEEEEEERNRERERKSNRKCSTLLKCMYLFFCLSSLCSFLHISFFLLDNELLANDLDENQKV